MKRFITLPLLILACCLLTGCFGLVVAHPRQKTSEQFCLGSRGVVSNGVSAMPLTEANVLALWGAPDSRRSVGENLTVLQYKGKLNWALFMPAFVVALPVPIPVGRNQVELYFQDGIARKASRSVPVYTGMFIGVPGSYLVTAWEKEEDTRANSGGALVGSGFVEDTR